MTKRQFVVLVFRLFALYLLYNLISNIGWVYSSAVLTFPSTGVVFGMMGFALAVALLIISLIWRKSEWLMRKVMATPALAGEKRDSSGPESPNSIENIELVAFSVLGLWAVFHALPDFFRQMSLAFISTPRSEFAPGLTSFDVASLLGPVAQMILGLWLFLRPWQFQEWIWRFWPKEEEEISEKATSQQP